jgi:signal transduction histidine kinase
MLPPFCDPATFCSSEGHRRRQERKHRLLRHWRDGLERQLAAVNAALSTLEQQMERDRPQDPAPASLS